MTISKRKAPGRPQLETGRKIKVLRFAELAFKARGSAPLSDSERRELDTLPAEIGLPENEIVALAAELLLGKVTRCP